LSILVIRVIVGIVLSVGGILSSSFHMATAGRLSLGADAEQNKAGARHEDRDNVLHNY